MVAPERENPRKGRHSPWTAPIQPASRKSKGLVGEPAVRRRSPEYRIKRPAAASAPEMSRRFPKIISMSASGMLRRTTFSMTHLIG